MTVNDEVMGTLRRLGVENGVVTTVRSEEGLLRFSNDRMTVLDLLDRSTVSIFVRENGRKAATSLSSDDTAKVLEATESLVKELRRHGSGVDVPLPRGPFGASRSSHEVEGIDLEWMTDTASQAIDAARMSGASRSAGSMRSAVNHIHLSTTAGAEAQACLPEIEISMRSFTEEGSSGHGLMVGAVKGDIDPIEVGEEAGGIASMSRHMVDLDAGRHDAVLAPMVFADLVSQVGSMASAFYVDMGMSFLRDRVGEQVASPLLSLSDDPTLQGTLGQRPFDDEGVPTRRNDILVDGILQGYLHNSQTAHGQGTESTANAGLIAPHPFNLVIGQGRGDLQGLMDEMGTGLVVTNAWYLRYQNHATGEFSVIPRDAVLYVKDGEVKGAVKGLRISDVLPSLLTDIEALGADRRWVRWWEVDTPTLSPSAWIRDVGFTRSSI